MSNSKVSTLDSQTVVLSEYGMKPVTGVPSYYVSDEVFTKLIRDEIFRKDFLVSLGKSTVLLARGGKEQSSDWLESNFDKMEIHDFSIEDDSVVSSDRR